jgi:hypothetical protein
MPNFVKWADLTPLEQTACTFSDYYKEVMGYRPHHIDRSEWTLEDYDREFKLLGKISKSFPEPL